MRIARGTSPWLAWAWGAAVLLLILAWFLANTWLYAPAGAALAIALVLLNFFRDPERTTAEGVVAPADGVIQFIDEADGIVRVATFMNPLNVHVNRAPLPGRVTAVEHKPGGFLPAFNKDSERNERVEWRFETELGDVRLVQIAGALARRIIPYLEPEEKVNKGDRIGIIRLGSRVDVYLPSSEVDLAVQVGDKVRAGETTLARLKR